MIPVNMLGLDAILTLGQDRSRCQDALQHPNWLVYGAGRAGRYWAQALTAQGAHVHAFLDRNAAIPDDIPIYYPTACPSHLRDHCAVLLALHNPGVDAAQVRRDLTAFGFSNICLLQDLIDAFPQRSHFWLAPAAETLHFSGDIANAYNALADIQSRQLLLALLHQRLNGDLEDLPIPSPDTQYCLPDARPPATLRYIDCGAYTGDTIAHLSKQGLSFEAIAAFEPNSVLYSQLCETAAPHLAYLFPCGVWDSMSQLRFTQDDAASHFDTTGTVIVQTVSLDQALPNFTPNFIKMDIEGAESTALQGARKMIATYRPHLAISAYHKPRDLWELLLQIQQWNLGYSFRLRAHAYNGFDTVLYATPDP